MRFCSMCGSSLTAGGAFCPRCGNRISPAISTPVSPPVPAPVYQPTFYPPPVSPKRSHTGLIVGVVLIVVVVAAVLGVGGAYAAASGAVASLQQTCSTTTNNVNWVGLTIVALTLYATPSTVLGSIQYEFGVHNPSSISVNSNWIVQDSWASTAVPDQQAFSVPAGTTQLVTFSVPITVTTAIHILTYGLRTGSISPLVSVTRDDSAYGFHFTNQLTSQSNTSTSSSSSSSSSNSTSTLPSC
jgi:hypothetical protein